MDKLREAEKTPSKPVASEEQRGIRAAGLLFKAATLASGAIVCAIGGPKAPPLPGD